ncbi:Per os infectivity factor 5 [Trabala vishnou gigantina nucleopolyhedrovirus]|uniref:Per os infectivity factor 5 n=1 Tax=Trabala vishnou gigantina nucleopolyhedrovirus TaxID=2863583 RepID=UPI0024820457|nr:Per os infectivity factor 5 [Trabala vishnou gigantina nucleopolyhedrovirus]QYC92690.1 Per os infectivity factor 5 [Trabala vishnou gigantina nucleopolyhedrovirus]
MTTFFSSLRRVNKVFPNANQFGVDNINVITSAPPGFNNVFQAPTTLNIGNGRFVPGYNIGNNQFVSTAYINRIMRNNDVGGIRNVFNVNNTQIDSLGQLRRMDNVPDVNLHSNDLRRTAVKRNFPDTNTRTPDGVQNVLDQNPNLNSHLSNLKTAGVALLLGAGVYLTFSAATLVQDIVAALNRVGGSYYVQGRNGGDQYDSCLLLERTCRLDSPNDTNINFCTFDPLLNDDPQALRQICQGFNYEREQTVCRASDPNADPDSPQYVDIADLPTGQTIVCIEPYNMGDLIGDLGLDNLLGDNGLFAKSSNFGKSVSEKLLPIILMLGGLVLLLVIGYFMFKKFMNSNDSNVNLNLPPTTANRSVANR